MEITIKINDELYNAYLKHLQEIAGDEEDYDMINSPSLSAYVEMHFREDIAKWENSSVAFRAGAKAIMQRDMKPIYNAMNIPEVYDAVKKIENGERGEKPEIRNSDSS